MKTTKFLIFVLGSLLVLSWLVFSCYIREKAIRLTLCGGDGIDQIFEHFSADYKDNHRVDYSGSQNPSTLVFKLKKETSFDGHRFDFGTIPGKVFLVEELSYEKPGFVKQVIDLSKAGQWIRSTADIRQPRYLAGGLLIETTGRDGRLFTAKDIVSRFGHAELNYSFKSILIALVLELLLALLVFAGPAVVKRISKRFMIQSAIFIAVNLILVIPAVYFFCHNQPDVFSITLKPEKSFYFAIFTHPSHVAKSLISVPCSWNNKFGTLNIPLKKEAVKNKIRIDFGELAQSIAVRDISIIRFGVLRYSLNLKNFDMVYPRRHQIEKINYKNGLLSFVTTGRDPYIIPSSAGFDANLSCRVVRGTLFWCIAGAEILLLLLLSQTIRDLILKISPIKLSNKENLLLSLSVAGAFAFIMIFSLPLQTFKMAEEIILFKINLLLGLLYWLVPAVFIGLAAVLYFLNKRYGAVFTVLLASLTVLFALESGWLSFNLPELNGDFDTYFKVPRMVFHIAVWLIGFILPLCFQKKLYRWIPLALLAVCVMNGAALIDVLMKKNSVEGNDKLIVKKTVTKDGTIEKVKYAVKNNVIMICLDGVTTESVFETFKNYPELKKRYRGFTLFANNVGMNTSTMFCVPGFFTGKLLTPEILATKYTTSMYSRDSALKNYIDRHFAIFLRSGLERMSYIYPDDGNDNKRKVNLLTPVEGTILQWMFHELYFFKITPFFLKGKLMQFYFYSVWPNRQKNLIADDNVTTPHKIDENYFYKKLEEAPLLSSEYPGAFHYHHFLGGHQPYKYDKDGNRVDRSKIPWRTDWQGYYERVVFEMKRVANLMDTLKKRGLYDDSVIIILADHGLEPTLKKDKIPSRFLPLLMVKCRNSKSDFSICNLPTSHSKIADFLKSDDIFAVKQQSLPDIFFMKIRQVSHAGTILYTIDDKLNIQNKEFMKAKKKVLDNIHIGVKYSLHIVGNNQFPPIAYKNLSRAWQGLYLDNPVVGYIQFKVSDRKALYHIIIDAGIHELNRAAKKVDIWTPSGAKTILEKGSISFSLNSVKPDKNGIIQINFQGSNVFMESLLVTKETSK